MLHDIDGLNEYFGQYGKMIDSVVMKDGAGKSRGFAFVTYEDPAVVRAVMAKEIHVIDNKQVNHRLCLTMIEWNRCSFILCSPYRWIQNLLSLVRLK